MSGQAIVRFALDADGIHLFPPGSPAFDALLDPARDPFADALLPYAVAIANATDRDAIAYSVRWICRHASGKQVYHEVSPFQFRSPDPGKTLPAHSTCIVSLVPGLGTAALAATEALRAQVASLEAFYRSQPAITIAVEAVVFRDGEAAGDDRNQWIPRWQAHMDADRALALALTADPPPASVADYLRSVRDAACERSEPPLEPSQLAAHTNRAHGYDDCYALIKGYFAHRLLESLSTRDEASLVASIRADAHWRAYPRIHR